MAVMRHIVTFESSAFDHDKNLKQFIAEASELTRGGAQRMLSRLYDDACDEGFAIRSEKTGKEARFAVSKVEEREGDILSWELVPSTETLRQNPQLAGYKVVVFND